MARTGTGGEIRNGRSEKIRGKKGTDVEGLLSVGKDERKNSFLEMGTMLELPIKKKMIMKMRRKAITQTKARSRQ